MHLAITNAGGLKLRLQAKASYPLKVKIGRTFKIQEAVAGGISVAGWQALGFSGFEVETRTAGAFAGTTVVAGNAAKSVSLYRSAGNTLDAVATIVSATPVINAAGATVISGLLAGDQFSFSINNAAAVSTGAITATATWQDLIDTISGNTSPNTLISTAGLMTRQAESPNHRYLTLLHHAGCDYSSSIAAARTFSLGLADPTGLLDPLTPNLAATIQETVLKFNSTSKLDGFTKDYNNIRDQIDALVGSAQYRGVNLLAGDDLTTFFNEDNSNKLITEGATFAADGLGLAKVNFTSLSSVETASTQN